MEVALNEEFLALFQTPLPPTPLSKSNLGYLKDLVTAEIL